MINLKIKKHGAFQRRAIPLQRLCSLRMALWKFDYYCYYYYSHGILVPANPGPAVKMAFKPILSRISCLSRLQTNRHSMLCVAYIKSVVEHLNASCPVKIIMRYYPVTRHSSRSAIVWMIRRTFQPLNIQLLRPPSKVWETFGDLA